ncbi:sigma-70 family RNA polymerase sigma factor [Jeongeupia chitinilytica]|uniref:RNA polymerase sigma factor n=1 Tax=Jeongeupia chitinilytica TaxID=1041641 RepID=A0ABQ3H2H6_9NEIS|nr:sigma-70 family RNA polymerase sigma factor [Jeongeupia chitinilytica]GHD66916.1 RNA polymerase sigma factor [Jeongeupia chitinilytica]
MKRSGEQDWTDETYLAGLRLALLRFARLQLRDAAAAEDAVQEALMAAWLQSGEFAGQSAHQTWVFGILRHKIVDTLRRRQRLVGLAELGAEADDEALDALLFNASGHWDKPAKPQAWPDPQTLLAQRQFWQLFEACLDHLPEQYARVFMAREFLGLEVAELCAEFEVSANHCSVLLYRARLRLRTCLSEKGLSAEDDHGQL